MQRPVRRCSTRKLPPNSVTGLALLKFPSLPKLGASVEEDARARAMKSGSPKNEPKLAVATPLSASSVTAPGRAEELLRAIIQGTAAVTGTQFFRSLVKHLAEGLHVRFAFVAECLPNLRARSLA